MSNIDEPWINAEQMRQMFESVKNWGRWGPDDEAGALNLITPQRRRAAAAEVTRSEEHTSELQSR